MEYNLITVNAGHSAKAPGAGANGYKEHVYARMIKDKVIARFKSVGVKTVDTTSNASTPSAVLAEQAKKCNAQPKGGRLDVSIHLNSGGGTGCEVLYYSEKALAAKVSDAIADVTGYKNRGAKERKELYFLRNTSAPAILIEVCFIDSKNDMKILNAKMNDIANAIVKAITGKSVHESKPAPKPPKKDDNKDDLYKVQTGAFKDKGNAERLAAELKKRGVSTYIVKE
ncbi:N-acetylmuramoyl-L-alanine amidase [Bacillus gobiensis]|uniref:N-acetylmuramoyl-L-alanine amidase n=1 Tax=Bacillus gobiensis TaxID=1441095 RepID=UPI003D1E0E1F